jgi:hypothetical protein
MAHETVVSTPIFDQLLREMAQRADDPATPPAPSPAAPSPAAPASPESEEPRAAGRRRHRAE